MHMVYPVIHIRDRMTSANACGPVACLSKKEVIGRRCLTWNRSRIVHDRASDGQRKEALENPSYVACIPQETRSYLRGHQPGVKPST